MSPDRVPLVAGNWKMHKTVQEAEQFIAALLPRVSSVQRTEVAICPTFTALGAMVDSTRGSRVAVCAQNMHQSPDGAFTGEVSAPMLSELGVSGVLLGHSERRELFNETDKALALKVPAALEAGLLPVLCVGETEEERERGDTQRKLRHQVQEDLARLESERLAEVVIAYEPIWAIGTGQVATPEQAQEAIAFVRALVGDRSREQAQRTRILYGGSVKPENARELLTLPDVDGALVGGASLDAEVVCGDRRRGRVAMALAPGPSALPVPRAALIVLDGWGLAEPGPGNAIAAARTPVFDELWSRYPTTTLTASGRAVGLPEGQMGNSEVGHLNLGAGSVVMQDLTRIDVAVEDGELMRNQVLRDALTGSERVHVIGLVSDGGVHSSLRHLEALIELAARLGVPDLVIHAFTDGRDTLPTSGAGFLQEVEGRMADCGAGRVGTVIGRYFAMDRDRRWDRVQKAYDLLVHGRAEHRAQTASQGVRDAYERGETDEFIAPIVVGDREARIRAEDSVLGLNFRPDRMREITRALAEPGFDEIERGGAGPVHRYTAMTEYEEDWSYPIAFAPHRPPITLAGVIAARGERQLHVAETEKYPHVTYFFNGGDEASKRRRGARVGALTPRRPDL